MAGRRAAIAAAFGAGTGIGDFIARLRSRDAVHAGLQPASSGGGWSPTQPRSP